MKKTDLDLLLSKFNDEKQFIGEGYYRLRKNSDVEYELAYLVPDACGTSSVHPQISFIVQGETIQPLSLIDHVATPMKYVQYNAETAMELETALTTLVNQFKQVGDLI